jgi:hypothetical protein
MHAGCYGTAVGVGCDGPLGARGGEGVSLWMGSIPLSRLQVGEHHDSVVLQRLGDPDKCK